jgi:hypothetical protein
MPVSRPAAGRQAVEYLGKSDREMVGVPVAYINEAVSPHWLRRARRRLQVARGRLNTAMQQSGQLTRGLQTSSVGLPSVQFEAVPDPILPCGSFCHRTTAL